LLPGVPLIASPFFHDILASDYFTAWEKTIAPELHHKGYAILDFPGGEPILNPSKTRWSQVTHYFFDNCAYDTPLASHVMAGKLHSGIR
jgi:hypothetical protein